MVNAVMLTRVTRAIWVVCLLSVGAGAHTWTFVQDGSIETQAGTWSFKKGGRIDAEFQRLKGTNAVVLRRSDGVICEVALSVLSEKDQDFVLHPPEDTRAAISKASNEKAKIERYWRNHGLNIVDDIEEADFPNSEKAATVYRSVVKEMKQLHEALGPEMTYPRFSDLLQETAFAVDKLKQSKGVILSRSFVRHVNEFFRLLSNSRDDWTDERKAERQEYRDYCAFLREKGWAQAGVQLRYCTGMAERSSKVLAQIIEAEAAVIQSEQAMARKRPASSPYPLLHAMTLDEITERLRSERGDALNARD